MPKNTGTTTMVRPVRMLVNGIWESAPVRLVPAVYIHSGMKPMDATVEMKVMVMLRFISPPARVKNKYIIFLTLRVLNVRDLHCFKCMSPLWLKG